MLRHIVLIGLFGAAFGSSFPVGADLGETTSRPPIDDADYFDCSGQTGTYHPHPWDCTRFIQCHNGRTADQPCAACNVGDPRCPEGYLNWNQRATTCDWPEVVGCIPGTRPPTATTPTEEETTTVEVGTTAAPPTNAPTSKPPGGEGEECDPDNCDVVGDCHGYSFCLRIESPAGPRNDTGVITPGDCGDLYFNPTKSNGTPIAVCDLWKDLDEETQERYREDPTCDPYCRLIAGGNCSNAYIYRDPNGVESSRACPADTILDVEARRCVDPCKASASANCAAC